MAQDDQDNLPTEEQKTPGRFTGPGLVVPLLILAIIAGYLYVLGSGPRKITYDRFIEQLRAKNVAEVDLFTRYAIGRFKQPIAAETTPEKSGEKAKRESETPSEPSAEKKPSEKKTSAKAEEKPDLRFMVTLPDRFSESEDFNLLKESGARYDFSVQVDPTVWIFAIGMPRRLACS